ncbi:MAG: biotin carboxylase N-terminal domain-containing protein [Pseudomonadota bacterium]
MFRKILIANRGEIACRVTQTARRLGTRVVAVHSDADARARHVALADEAVHVGGPAPADSYLKGERIIAAAKATGAEAIHPGYGFLSENPEFVEAVEAAGLIFIGPSAKAIRTMGLKDAAKALMEKAGVPVVPGFHEDDQDDGRLRDAAAAIGFPVLIKAVAGGGGKGMRRVDRREDFAAALASARGEARTAFGSDAVLIEKFLATARHIEMQIFGDGVRAVHLFERDCSLQRRHQKVIEEAPAPGMTEAMRAAMGAAAVRAAEAIGYAGAGTVEFIVDASEGLREDRFYFMEMNTRLQVEHPVTEAIAGIDLVEWQLRVAAGEGLPARQNDLSIAGHAFEARLYAEDVQKGFLPATGTLAHLSFPDHVRADTGVRTGDAISPWYDPMIAKLIVHGPTRRAALNRLERALAGTQVAGTVTNLAFLRALARHEDFAHGGVDTGLIDREVAALSTPPAPCSRTLALAALGAMGLHETARSHAGFALWAAMTQTVRFMNGEAEIAARVTAAGPRRFEVTVGEARHLIARDDDRWFVDGAQVDAEILVHTAGISVFWGNNYHFQRIDPLDRTVSVKGDNGIEAPMPGLVKAMMVARGDRVVEGQSLVVLEAMKMEHTLIAPRAGQIAEVLAEVGSQVGHGALLVTLEEETE